MTNRIAIILLVIFAGRAPAEDTKLDFFEKRVRPLLVKKCLDCHGAAKAKNGLRLDSRAGWSSGGQRGPAIVPGSPHLSLLLKAVRYTDPKLQMPPDGKLAEADIAALERWIAEGAMDPREGKSSKVASTIDFEKERKFWSFQPISKAAVPRALDPAWSHEIDRFIHAKLDPTDLTDRSTWLRRVTFSLTGLPPTVRELGVFLKDKRDDDAARAAVIDRLLASRAYGEHFARHWLDLVRYGDTSGAPSDYPLREMWRYRNYVIDSYNADKPYDRFVREQIAGDLLPFGDSKQAAEQITATGYLALAKRFNNSGISKHLVIEDVIDNLGKTYLGLSLGCARCHDHKFDPIPARDYYALYGIFDSTLFPFPGKEHNAMSFGYYLPQDDEDSRMVAKLFGKAERMTRRYAEIGDIRGPMREEIRALEAIRNRSPEQNKLLTELEDKYSDLSKERSEMKSETIKLRKNFPDSKADLIYAVKDGQPHNARIQRQGDPEKLGDEIARGFLEILGDHELRDTNDSSGRRQLADWLMSSNNPLTARVIVNRVWQWHFGHGLVRTPNDFGHRGAKPTHPELLDWLAHWFRANDWSFKKLNRLLLTSRTYALAHESRSRRLTAEEIRDSLLLVSGQLSTKPVGEHDLPTIRRLQNSQGRPYRRSFAEVEKHRSLYLFQHRNAPHPFLNIFDGADPSANTPIRGESTTALQGLFFLNSEFFHHCADAFAGRLEQTGLDWGFQAAYGRRPTPTELELARRLYERTKDWKPVARVLLASNQFIHIE